MAIYKCLQSGNTVEFTEKSDIDSMKGHGGYVLVEAVEAVEPEPKRMGRPPKPKENLSCTEK